ncbi:MAG: N-acetylmuramoyl-L-alanine amidase [Carboxylicivirga sp.]|jgi:N-acetylmuramoyl-L-alanine amidase|nr:N-acetylmuramoyl-L-alanine amidase [Carboxylicivirga sp.]
MKLSNKKVIKVKYQCAFLIAFLICHMGMSQVTGLSDYEIFLDPGHAQKENMGLYNYSEAEKVLQVALELKNMFETQTDIAKVHMCRLNDNDQISLSARTDLANSLSVDFYYSIHSDAGSPSANSTLTLSGGYNKDGVTIEKAPNGGKAFGEILVEDLTGTMRISTRGHYTDRVYYQGNVSTHTNQWPYLYVNRTTNMASLLSEAGFHTNPGQQMRNLNAEWKKMEALSAFRSFLQFKGIDRPAIGIVAGVVTDEDTGLPVNGVDVKIGDKTYTTDSYESLFKNYSSDPEALRNGFYFIEGLAPGASVEVEFTSSEYQTKTRNIVLGSNPNGKTDENIQFVDVTLTSTAAPQVVSVTVEEGELTSVVPGKYLKVSFSRKMDRTTVEQAISINPAAALTYFWLDDFTLKVETGQLAFATDYSLKLDGAIAKNSLTNQFLDGDASGEAGGDYNVEFTTSPQDLSAPLVVQQWPENNEVCAELRPLIRFVFDEKLDDSSVSNSVVSVVSKSNSVTVTGEVQHAIVGGQSVLHFFPSQDMINDESYILTLKAGIRDLYGNAIDAHVTEFTINEMELNQITVIDDFESGIVSWWKPQASGSTTGIVTEQTDYSHEAAITVKSIESAGSMKMSYGWLSAGSGYIREYLPPSASQNSNRFDTRHVLQMFVFGDGSENMFRFMIKDGNRTYEASGWYTVDWIGWKLVSWDLTAGTSNAWVNGDGVLDGDDFYMDGIHIKTGASGKLSGSIYFDDLRYAQRRDYVPTSMSKLDREIVKVYPNPVRDQLFIEVPSVIKNVKIIDLSGRIVISHTKGLSKNIISTSSIDEGIYIIHIATSDGLYVEKINVIK